MTENKWYNQGTLGREKSTNSTYNMDIDLFSSLFFDEVWRKLSGTFGLWYSIYKLSCLNYIELNMCIISLCLTLLRSVPYA